MKRRRARIAAFSRGRADTGSRAGGLLAELYVRDPASSWRRLRELAGRTGRAFAGSFPGVGGDPARPARRRRGPRRWRGPAARGAGATLRPTAALGARPARQERPRARQQAHDQRSDASIHGPRRRALGIAHLEPSPKSVEPMPALGVIGNYLVVAETRPCADSAGPFVARTLPTRPAPAESVVLTLRQQRSRDRSHSI